MRQNGTNGNGQANGYAFTPREKVLFPTNETVYLRLEFDPPDTPTAGRFGDQFQYKFQGSKIAWVEPSVHAQITAAGCRAGDEVAITKIEQRIGNKKGTRWLVETISEEPPHDEPPPPAPPAPAPAAAPKTRATKASQANPGNQAKPAAPPAPAPADPAAPSGLAAIATAANPLAAALILAIDAIETASQHAIARHGSTVDALSISEDSILRLAITAFIQAHGGRGQQGGAR